MIIHSYKAQVVAFFWQHMKLPSVLNGHQKKDNLRHVLKSLGFSALIDVLDQIASQYSYSHKIDQIDDDKLHEHILFLHHA